MAFEVNDTVVIDDNNNGMFNICNVGRYTTATLPTSGSSGDILFNETTRQFMSWGEDGQGSGEWLVLKTLGTKIDETGSLTTSGQDSVWTPGDGYKYAVWTSPGSFTVADSDGAGVDMHYVLVAGGGGGGSYGGGGGGAGGFQDSTQFDTLVDVFLEGTYDITIGSGGSGGPNAQPGQPSTVIHQTTGYRIVAVGGGGGGTHNGTGPYSQGQPGGSGGGGRNGTSGQPGNLYPSSTNPAYRYGVNVQNQGNRGGQVPGPSNSPGGGAGAGGGGRGGTGKNAPTYRQGGNGGNGWYVPVLFHDAIPTAYGTPGPVSSRRYFSGGGGGGTYGPAGDEVATSGGPGGGGAGGKGSNGGTSGQSSTGSGGGGAGSSSSSGGSGGSGIFILRYPTSIG